MMSYSIDYILQGWRIVVLSRVQIVNKFKLILFLLVYANF